MVVQVYRIHCPKNDDSDDCPSPYETVAVALVAVALVAVALVAVVVVVLPVSIVPLVPSLVFIVPLVPSTTIGANVCPASDDTLSTDSLDPFSGLVSNHETYTLFTTAIISAFCESASVELLRLIAFLKVRPLSYEALNITSQLPDLLVHHTTYALPPETAIGALCVGAFSAVSMGICADTECSAEGTITIAVVIAPATTIIANVLRVAAVTMALFFLFLFEGIISLPSANTMYKRLPPLVE
jgi:hypothetical protein